MQSNAKADWDERIALRSDETRAVQLPDLDPPASVTAVGGVGQVTVDWTPVPGAVGYVILRGPDDCLARAGRPPQPRHPVGAGATVCRHDRHTRYAVQICGGECAGGDCARAAGSVGGGNRFGCR